MDRIPTHCTEPRKFFAQVIKEEIKYLVIIMSLLYPTWNIKYVHVNMGFFLLLIIMDRIRMISNTYSLY
jgi:hypothetical protein